MSGFVVYISLFFSPVRVQKKILPNIFHSQGKEMAVAVFKIRSKNPGHSHVVVLFELPASLVVGYSMRFLV